MMRMMAVVATLVAAPSLAAAQPGITLWAGAGGTSPEPRLVVGHEAKQLGAQLGLPVVPVALRADAMLLGSLVDRDLLSYNVNAVFQMRMPVLQPYVLVGKGRYVPAPSVELRGWNYGAGARLGLGRFGIFGELRRHQPIERTLTVVGVTF